MMARARLYSRGLLCLAVAWSRVARADDDAQRAQLLQAALEARSAGRHEEALAAASRAAAIKPSSSLLRFIAEEHAELAEPVLAYREAERCLAQTAKEPASDNREAVVTGCRFLLSQLGERVAVVTVQVQPASAPNLEIVVAGEPVTAGHAVVAPGATSVVARASGYVEARQTLELSPGDRVTLPLRLAPSAAATPPALRVAAPSPQREARRPAWVAPVLFGTAGAGFVVALASHLVANARYDALERDCAAMCPADFDSRKRQVTTLDTVTWVGAISGVALAGGGTAWLVFSRAPAASGSGYFVQAEGRF
jgi:hypothetical protein